MGETTYQNLTPIYHAVALAKAEHLTPNTMTYKEIDSGYIVRLFQGEKLIESLTKLCTQKGIKSGRLEGIGAISEATLGYYDLDKKQYHFTTFDEVIYELVSMTGNVALVDGESFLHIHASISNHDLQVYGGHVQEMTVGVTVEVVLRVFNDSVERQFDDNIGLKLMKLPCGFKI